MLPYKNAIIVLVIIAGLAMLGSAFLKLNEPIQIQDLQTQNFEHTEERFEEFSSAELEDVCAVPDGYDKEGWEQHMSHHPERYEGCL